MAEEQDNTEAEAGGGKKKLIIIGAAALVLLLGAGGAAFFLVGGDEEAPADGEVAEEEAVEQGEPAYYGFDPEFIVHLAPGGPVGMLQVAIQVLTRTPTVTETLAANDPMIRHHLLNLLEGQEASRLLTVEGKTALQSEIHALLNTKLKELDEPGEVQGVYFTQFVMQ